MSQNKPTEVKDSTILIRDYGKFGPMIAERLAHEFGRVILYTHWEKEFPKPLDVEVGVGCLGVERTDDFFSALKEADTIMFTDLYEAGLQADLRERGFNVWGMGGAEELEKNRWLFRQWLQKNRMARAASVRIVGMSALKAHLKPLEHKFVKVSKFRGIGETFEYQSWKLNERRLKRLEVDLGIRAEHQEFIVDEPIDDAQEFGYDGYTVKGPYAKIAAWGLEKKDEVHIERISAYSDLPEQLRMVNEELSRYFKKYGSQGIFATEVRIDKEGIGYFTDPCIRIPYPPIEGLLEIYKNWGLIVFHGARGELVEPEPVATHFALCSLHSDESIDEDYALEIPRADMQFVKLPDKTIQDGRVIVLPRRGDWDLVGRVVGLGSSAEEAVKVCTARAKRIKGDKLTESSDDLKDALASIVEARKTGIKF